MPAVLLYVTASCALIFWAHRSLRRIGRTAAILLFLIPLCFTGRALLTGRIYAPADLPYAALPLKDYAAEYGIERIHNGWLSDLYTQMIPWNQEVRRSLARGEWPLWNPSQLSGAPLLANMQSAPFDPLHVAGLLLPLPQDLTFQAAMTLFLAALLTFLFAREIGLGEAAALIAAAGYALCHQMAFFVGWPLARCWVYLPLLLLATRLVVRRRTAGAALLLTGGFCLALLSGHPETLLHLVAVSGVYGIVELIRVRRQPLRAIGLSVVSGVVALLLCAIALLPFLAAAPMTEEFAARHAYFTTMDVAASPHLLRVRLGQTLFPFYAGQAERGANTTEWQPATARVGSLILVLALLAPFVAWRRTETWFFVAWTLFCIGATLGIAPIARLLHALPLFNVALNDRLSFAASFSLAILAAIAVEEWPTTRRPAALLVIGLATAALAAGVAAVWQSQLALGMTASLMTFLAAVEIGALLLLFAVRALPVKARAAVPLLLLLLLIQRTAADGAIYPAIPARAFYPVVPALRFLQAQPGPLRVAGLGPTFIPDTAALYGLEDPRGYDAMTLAAYADTYSLWSQPKNIFINRVDDLSAPFLSFLNVRYALASVHDTIPEGWRVVFRDRATVVAENLRVLPRAFVPRVVHYRRDPSVVVSEMAAQRDFAEVAWMMVREYHPHEVSNGSGTVTVQRVGGRYDLEARMKQNGWVVVSESAWPGWRAYIDGRRVEWKQANNAFIGLYVPAGHHRIRLVYLPSSFTRGRTISLVTLLALGAFLLLRKRLQKPGAVGVGGRGDVDHDELGNVVRVKPQEL